MKSTQLTHALKSTVLHEVLEMPTATQSEYVSASEAARILKTNVQRVPKVAMISQVRARALPSTPIRYCREDLERVAREAEVVAVASQK